MAPREGVNVQERIAGDGGRPRVIDTIAFAKKGTQLTKSPSRGACNSGSPLYSNSNSATIELSNAGARIQASPTFDDLTEDAGERPMRVKFAIAMIMLRNLAVDEMPYLTADDMVGGDRQLY